MQNFQSRKLCVEIFMILIIQISLYPRNCSGQFHWGKNHRLEAQQLRDMFSRAVNHKDIESGETSSIEIDPLTSTVRLKKPKYQLFKYILLSIPIDIIEYIS